jgi:energy-coupling factor transporter ATP-binding protein EcfA2
MRLEKITYSYEESGGRCWKLPEFVLKDINLLVGKNASGKSMSLNVIAAMHRMLKQKQLMIAGKWNLLFRDQDLIIRYELELKDQKVVMERFHVDDECRFDRNAEGAGKIFAFKEDKLLDFQSPVDELAIFSRRDSIQHPYLEPLNEWVRNVRHYHFGDRLGKDRVIMVIKENDTSVDPSDENATSRILVDGIKKYSNRFVEMIINDMVSIGYKLTDVKLAATPLFKESYLPGVPYLICVQEEGLIGDTNQIDMSNGMFRALSIVIHLNYSLVSGIPSCLIIDDIGEGLDFERSCNLIEVVMNKAKESSVQLIMSTNDRFVMNKVPLEYWSVIRRKGHTSEIINKENSPELFEDFKFTGLNNFDFFARYLED